MGNIESILQEHRVFPPSAEFVKQANVSGMDAYLKLCAEAERDYGGFWAKLARENLHWTKPFTQVLDESNAPFYKWFADGELNASYNCLDRNLGNGNRWIMIDLEGTESNRDGIGAIVRVTAGGVTQMRVQDGGVHHRSQNHSRLHFGLAKNTQIEKITVQWPSGVVQELQSVKANQALRIKEPAQ